MTRRMLCARPFGMFVAVRAMHTVYTTSTDSRARCAFQLDRFEICGIASPLHTHTHTHECALFQL